MYLRLYNKLKQDLWHQKLFMKHLSQVASNATSGAFGATGESFHYDFHYEL